MSNRVVTRYLSKLTQTKGIYQKNTGVSYRSQGQEHPRHSHSGTKASSSSLSLPPSFSFFLSLASLSLSLCLSLSRSFNLFLIFLPANKLSLAHTGPMMTQHGLLSPHLGVAGEAPDPQQAKQFPLQPSSRFSGDGLIGPAHPLGCFS